MDLSKRWSQYADMKETESLLARFFGRLPPWFSHGCPDNTNTIEWANSVKVTEDDKMWSLKAGLPDDSEDSVKIKIQNGVLTIRREGKARSEQQDPEGDGREWCYGSFFRSFALPKEADGPKAVVEFQNGVLQVHVPKHD